MTKAIQIQDYEEMYGGENKGYNYHPTITCLKKVGI